MDAEAMTNTKGSNSQRRQWHGELIHAAVVQGLFVIPIPVWVTRLYVQHARLFGSTCAPMALDCLGSGLSILQMTRQAVELSDTVRCRRCHYELWKAGAMSEHVNGIRC